MDIQPPHSALSPDHFCPITGPDSDPDLAQKIVQN